MIKTNNSTILKIAIPLVGIAFVAYGFYLMTDYRLNVVEATQAKLHEEAEAVDEDINILKSVVGLIEYKLTELNETMKDVLKELKK